MYQKLKIYAIISHPAMKMMTWPKTLEKIKKMKRKEEGFVNLKLKLKQKKDKK